MKVTTLCAIALAFAFSAQADVAPVADAVTMANATSSLTVVGSGVRKKKFFVVLSVYNGKLLISDPSRYVKTPGGALASLDNQTSVAMQMEFLMNVGKDNLSSGFEEGLLANNVSLSDPDVVKLLEFVSQTNGVKKGATLSVVFKRNGNGTETLTFELVDGGATKTGTHVGAKGFTNKIVSAWLGNPSDDLMGQFKAELLK